MCDRKGLRPKDSAEISAKLRPKQFRHYCLFSAIRPKGYFWPKNGCIGHSLVFSSCLAHQAGSAEYHEPYIWLKNLAKSVNFWPKQPFSAEKAIFGRKFSWHFGIFHLLFFGYGVSAKNLFRSHTNKKAEERLMMMSRTVLLFTFVDCKTIQSIQNQHGLTSSSSGSGLFV